ncbi:MAG: hypothetical protein HZA53_11080 [Planctomycetes bacterium]|nr:hypothetical protein [Planctomycetota bacterium]
MSLLPVLLRRAAAARSRWLSVLIAVTLPASALHAGVLVVDSGGGAAFTTIQAAVNAAVDGDVILVKTGTSNYAGFTVQDKELVIVGDRPTFPVRVRGRVVVQNLAATRTVVLGWLDVDLPPNPTPLEALVASGIAGQLRVQRCLLKGARGMHVEDPSDPAGYGMGSTGGTGVTVLASSGGIAFVGCTIDGGAGGGVGGTGATLGGLGGDGVRCEGARVVFHDDVVRAGRAGDGSYSGNDGGIGARILSGVFATQTAGSNTSFTGGNGSMGEDLGSFCLGPGGDGGHGLWIGSGVSSWQLACTNVAGLGQCGSPPGQAGQPSVVLGSLATFQVTSVKLTAPPLVRAGTTMPFTFTGTPGDALYLESSRRTSFDGLPSWRGFRLARPVGLNLAPRVPVPPVILPASGTVTLQVDAPELGPGELERTVYYQVYRAAPNGSITLGSFAAVTVVDPSY